MEKKKPFSLEAYFRLTRIEHGFMLMLAVAIAEIVAAQQIDFFSLPIILSLLVPLFSEMASFSLNDLLDVKADRINKRKDRPLVSGQISKETAIATTVLGYSFSILLAWFINPIAFAIAVFFCLASIAYNYRLKEMPAVGNVYIGLSMAIPFVFGNFAVSPQPNPIALSLALLAFLSGFAREIIKSAEDLKGDRKGRGARTLPAVIGVKNSVLLAVGIYLLFLLSTGIPFALGLNQNPPYPLPYIPLALVLLCDLIILKICIKLLLSQEKKNLDMARKLSLPALFIGMLGILLGAI